MSTGYECEIVEVTPGEWFYVLQNWDCPVGAWDWREYATAYGPFKSEEEAIEHLDNNHANPGGYSVQEWEPNMRLSDVEQQLFADARERKLQSFGRRAYNPYVRYRGRL